MIVRAPCTESWSSFRSPNHSGNKDKLAMGAKLLTNKERKRQTKHTDKKKRLHKTSAI